MLEQYMKSSSADKKSKKPHQSRSSAIPELKELEKEIVSKKPNNVMKFIKNWASTRCKQPHNRGKINSDSQSEEETAKQFLNRTSRRRNAVFFQGDGDKDKKARQAEKPTEKLEEVKSRLIIILSSMPILECLNAEEVWQLVERSVVFSCSKDTVVLPRHERVAKLYIIISGEICRIKKDGGFLVYGEGGFFGEDSVLFQRQSADEYVAKEPSKLASIWGYQISSKVQEAHKRKYQLILKGIYFTEFLSALFPDEMEKVASMLMNQPELSAAEGDSSLNLPQYKKSAFVVMEGKFDEYYRSLDSSLKGFPIKKYGPGDCIGAQALVGRQKETSIICNSPARVIEMRVPEIEKLVGSILKITRRKQR